MQVIPKECQQYLPALLHTLCIFFMDTAQATFKEQLEYSLKKNTKKDYFLYHAYPGALVTRNFT